MVIRNNQHRWTSLMAMAIMMLMGLNACSSGSDEPEPDLNPGDVATTFTKVKKYDQTSQFKTDLNAFASLIADAEALRWTYWMLTSNNFKDGFEGFFTVDPDDTGKNNPEQLATMYRLINHVVANKDAYDNALEALEANGIIDQPNTSSTRGKIGSSASFAMVAKESTVLSRQSVMYVLRKGGWATDSKKLTELYNTLPAEDRKGYNNAAAFWDDFSHGKIDDRASQVFVNLYTYDHMDFGSTANDLNITPYKNAAVIGQKLAEAGANLILDAHPAAKILSIGNDAFQTIESSLQLMASTAEMTVGTFNGDTEKAKEALANWTKQMAHNAVNYGRAFYKWKTEFNNLGNDVMITDFGWNEMTDFLVDTGADAWDFTANEILFSDHLIETFFDHGKELGLKTSVTFKDVNGDRYPMIIIYDEKTGEVRMGFTYDADGNIIMNPGEGGVAKTVTVVDKQLRRKTKTIIVDPEKEDNVEFGLDDDEEVLEETPEHGILELRPDGMIDESGNGGDKKVWIYGNYLYYTYSTKDDWLKARVVTDLNQVIVTLTDNSTGEERRGHVTISATDSKGKVLKSAVFSVRQMPKPVTKEWVKAYPSSLQFDAKGGKQEVEIDHSNALNYILAVVGDDLVGWCDLTSKETATGWNYVVDVDPNDTGKERSGTFTIYAAASQEYQERALKEGVFDPDVVQATTVIIKQTADEDEPVVGFDPSTDITMLQIWFDIKIGEGNKEKENFLFNEENIKVSKSGSAINITCSKSYRDWGTDVDVSVSMTVNYDSNGWGNITGINLDAKYYNQEYDYSWRRQLSATNVKKDNGSGDLITEWWSATEEKGLTINNYSERGYSYISDPSNKITVAIRWRK